MTDFQFTNALALVANFMKEGNLENCCKIADSLGLSEKQNKILKKILKEHSNSQCYVAYLWKYNCDRYAIKSRVNESLADFKKRVLNCYPYEDGWNCEFSTFIQI